MHVARDPGISTVLLRNNGSHSEDLFNLPFSLAAALADGEFLVLRARLEQAWSHLTVTF